MRLSRPGTLFQRYLNEFRHHIQSSYAADERLPSYREWAQTFDVSINMAFRIVQRLASEGVVTCQGRHCTRSSGSRQPAEQHNRPMTIGLISSKTLVEWQYSPLYALLREQARKRSIAVVNVPHRLGYRSSPERRRIQWAKVPWNTFDVGLAIEVEDFASLMDLRRKGRPLLAVDSDSTLFGIDSVAFDNFNAGWKAGAHLFDFGHKRVGVTVECHSRPFPWDTAWLQRRHGFEAAIGYRGGMFRAEWYVDFPRGMGQSWLPYIRRWLVNWRSVPRSRPSAVFVVHNHLDALVSECKRLKVKIPEDLSIVTVADNCESTWISEHRFTHLHADFQLMARRAIDVAQEFVEGRPRAPALNKLSNEGRVTRLFNVPMLLVPGNTVARL